MGANPNNADKMRKRKTSRTMNKDTGRYKASDRPGRTDPEFKYKKKEPNYDSVQGWKDIIKQALPDALTGGRKRRDAQEEKYGSK